MPGNRLLDLYEAHLLVDIQLFPGIQDVLDYLQQNQITWGIVTNKPQRFTQPIVNGLQFSPAPGTVICPDHVSQTKPHPEPLLKACEQLSVEPAHTLYIGDHIRDIEAGKNANMRTVGCTYGYLPPSEEPGHWQADHLIDTANQLIHIIEQYQSS